MYWPILAVGKHTNRQNRHEDTPSTRIKPGSLQPLQGMDYIPRFYINLLEFGIGDPSSPGHPKLRKVGGFEVVNDDQRCVIVRDRKLVEVCESMSSGLDRGNRVI